MQDILRKIHLQHYCSQMPYPDDSSPQSIGARLAHDEDEARLFGQFQRDCLEQLGIRQHPRGQQAFNMAWGRCHQEGHEAVFRELRYLADLLWA